MWDLLKHPLFLLLVGAALTGIIVPAITRWWQIQQKELEIKVSLVSEISEAVMKLVMAIQFAHVAPRRYPDQQSDELARFQKDLNDSYREWEVRSAVVGTKLQAYLPHTPIPAAWTEFSNVLADFYAQEGMTKDAIRTFAVTLSGQLSKLLDGENVGHEWTQIKDAILKKKSRLIADVLASRRLNIGTRPLPFYPTRG